MKKIGIIVLLALLGPVLCAQNQRTIDSINNIPYEVKIKRGASLEAVYLKNAAAAKKINYRRGEAMSYSNLGLIYYYLGKYNLHLDHTLRAIKMYEEMHAYGLLAAEYGLLGYSMKRRNMPMALRYMQKGKSIAETRKDTTSLLSIYNNYGVLKEMKNELDSALYFYNKGLVIKKIVKDSVGIPFSLNNIAGIYVMTKRFDEAKVLYDQALEIRFRIKDEIGIAENYSYSGDLYSAQQHYEKAASYYRKTLERAHKYGYIDMIQNNYKSLSNCYEQLGNRQLALENYKLYSKYKDSLLNKETNSKIAELEVRFETNKKEKQLAENKNQLLQNEAEARRKNNLLLTLSLLSLFIAVTGYLLYRQQKLKNRQQAQEHELKTAISQIETQNKLQEQRLDISRDLHDNIGAQLTFIISSVDNIKYAFDLKNTKLDEKLQSINNFTKATIIELRDTIWAMNNTEITFENLLSRVLNFIENAKNAKEDTDFRFTIDENLEQLKLTSVMGMNIYRTVQEAVNNAIKYSHAAVVSIDFRSENDKISIAISDNGTGFNTETTEKGNGLGNMQKRMETIGGTFGLESEPGKGTTISISIEKAKISNGIK